LERRFVFKNILLLIFIIIGPFGLKKLDCCGGAAGMSIGTGIGAFIPLKTRLLGSMYPKES